MTLKLSFVLLTIISFNNSFLTSAKNSDACGLRLQPNKTLGHGHPWFVSLTFRLDYLKDGHNLSMYSICGGTILTDRWILSAAHCRYSEDKKSLKKLIHATPGVHHKSDVGLLGKTIFNQQFEAIIPHQDFIKQGSPYDALLIRTKKPIEFDDNIRPICFEKIPLKKVNQKDCFLAGLGNKKDNSTEVYFLKEARYLINQTSCKANMICGQGNLINKKGFTKKQHHHSCEGDIGNSLTCRLLPKFKDKKLYGIGIASKSAKCNQTGLPTTFASIEYLYGWIKKQMNKYEVKGKKHATDEASRPVADDMPWFSWAVVIRIRKFFTDKDGEEYESFVKCPGTVLTSGWVITTAGCVSKQSKSAIEVFRFDFNIEDDKQEIAKIPFKKVVVHPKYRPDAGYSDADDAIFHNLALINIEELSFKTENIGPVAWPREAEKQVDRSECLITRLTATGNVVFLERNLAHIANCEERRKTRFRGDLEFCAGGGSGVIDESSTKPDCSRLSNGGAGGAIVCRSKYDGSYLLIGIVTADRGCERGDLTTAIDISKHYRWISKTTDDN